MSATGNINFHSYIACLGQPVIIPSQYGFGALDDVLPLFVTVACYGRDDIIEALILAGADVNQRTARGQTVLHALCGTYEGPHDADDPTGPQRHKMRILLGHGVDVNVCDDHGQSPLHYAARNSSPYFVRTLLQHGADVYLKDERGFTALDYAATVDYRLTMTLIDEYNFPIDQLIRAYEYVAPIAPSSLEVLRKATLLREVHSIPKRVLPPLECFEYEKEWETIDELEKYGFDNCNLLLPCLLTRERISKESSFEIAPLGRTGRKYILLLCHITFTAVVGCSTCQFHAALPSVSESVNSG